MKKRILAPVLLLATISLHGMSRLAQLGRQSVPALRSQLGQPGRLPATMPGSGAFPRAACRTISSSSRAQGAYTGAQQAAFGGRSALLLGGAGAAAFAGKAAYDYFDTPEGRLLKRAHAAEESRSEILARHEAAQRARNEVAQFWIDAYIKYSGGKRPMSQEDTAELIDKLPSLLTLNFAGADVVHHGRVMRASNVDSRIKSGSDLVFELLSSMRQVVGKESNITKPGRISYPSSYSRRYYRPWRNEEFIGAITDKLVDMWSKTENVAGTQDVLMRMFEQFDDLRIPILEKLTQHEQDSDWMHNRLYSSLAYDIRHNILPGYYSGTLSQVDSFAGDATKDKLVEELESGRDKLIPRILELLAEQRKGAGGLVRHLTTGESEGTQRPAWLFAKEIIAHPELTPQLAAVYNNPAEEFDGFRDLVDQTTYAYSPDSSEDKAFAAIKREAKSGGSSRVQE